MIKQPNPTLKSKGDWTPTDLEAMPVSFIPATAYQPDRATQPSYDADYTTWEIDGERVAARDFYRIAWRRMAATTGFRTMYPTIIPPGAAHVDPVHSLTALNNKHTVAVGAVLSSLVSDFVLRSTGTSDLRSGAISALFLPEGAISNQALLRRYLRLNCLTEAYSPLWEEITGETWTIDTPLRNAWDRQTAQIEIDALVAQSLGISADELCMIYRTQFPVMRRYDEEDRFDANGRLVPKEILKADAKLKEDQQLSEADRTWVHPQSEVTYVFEYPFRKLDREADLREAYERYAGMASSS